MEFSDSQPNFFEDCQNLISLPPLPASNPNPNPVNEVDANSRKLIALLTANCRSQERTIAILREQGPYLAKKIDQQSTDLEKQIKKLEMVMENILLQLEEQTECLAVLTNRRTKKLEKDCERRKRKRQENTNQLSA